jgi:predicted PurR-regulated permease PerM
MSTEPSSPGIDDSEQRPRQAVRITDLPSELVWKIATIVAIALIVGLLFLDVLALLIRPLGVLLAGIIIALTLAPLADYLERHMPRFAGILLLYLVLFAAVGVAAWIILSPLVAEVASLVENFPQYYGDAQRWFARELGLNVRQDMDSLAPIAGPLGNALVTFPLLIASGGIELLVALVVSLYWLHSMPRLKAFFVSLFPPQRQDRVSEVLHRISIRMGGYMRGVILAGAVVAAAVFLGLTILGVRYALVLALLAFLGEFFPNVGPILAGIPAVAIALMDSPGLALMVIIYYIIIQQLESYVLMPIIMAHGDVEIPPLMTTFAVFTGFFVGGVLWAILAIPISGAILTLTHEVIAPAIRARHGEAGEQVTSESRAGGERSSPVPQLKPSSERTGAPSPHDAQ